VVHLVRLDRLLRATTKKGRQLYEEKVNPRQNPGYAYVWGPQLRWNEFWSFFL